MGKQAVIRRVYEKLAGLEDLYHPLVRKVTRRAKSLEGHTGTLKRSQGAFLESRRPRFMRHVKPDHPGTHTGEHVKYMIARDAGEDVQSWLKKPKHDDFPVTQRKLYNNPKQRRLRDGMEALQGRE